MPAERIDSDGCTPNAAFTTTHWSVVLAAGRADIPQAAEALERLCRAYWYPLYVYVRRRGQNEHDARDLTQAFFLHLFERHALGRVAPHKGRFRSFLLASLDYFLADQRDRALAKKRGGDREFIFIDAQDAEERYKFEPTDEQSPCGLTFIYRPHWLLSRWGVPHSTHAQVFNAASGQRVLSITHPILGGPSVFRCFASGAFSADSEHFAAFSAEGTQERAKGLSNFMRNSYGVSDGPRVVDVWETRTGKPIYRFQPGVTEVFKSLSFSPDGNQIAAAWQILNETRTEGIALMNATNGQTQSVIPVGEPNVSIHWQFRPDFQRVVSYGKEADWKVWDPAAGKALQTLLPKTNCSFAKAFFSPRGRFLISLRGLKQDSNNGVSECRVWDGQTFQLLWTDAVAMSNSLDRMPAMDCSPNEEAIAISRNGPTVRVLETRNGRQLAIFSGSSSSINAVGFGANGTAVSVVSDDSTILTWDLKTGQELRRLRGHVEPVYGIFSHNGQRVATVTTADAAVGGQLKVWNLSARRQETLTLLGHTNQVLSVACSPNGKRIASSGADGTVRIWDSESGQALRTLLGHTGQVNSVEFSPDSRQLVSGGADGSVRLWNMESGEVLRSFTDHTNAVQTTLFSPDGRQLIALASNARMIVWDLGTSKIIRTWKAPHDESKLEAATLIPGPQPLVAVRVASGPPAFLSLQTGEELHGTFASYIEDKSFPLVGALAFHRDTKQLAVSTGQKNQIHLWKMPLGLRARFPVGLDRTVLKLSGHLRRVAALVFSPDGKRLVSASEDGTIRVWSTDMGLEVISLREHPGAVTSVVFSPDGRKLISGGEDGTVRIWDASELKSDRDGEEDSRRSAHR